MQSMVTVCVKVPDHCDSVMAAIAAGKHIYSEWPLGRNTEEATHMLRAAEAKGVRHAVGLLGHASPSINYARDLIAQGFIGKPLSGTLFVNAANWGATLDRAYYAFRWFMTPAEGWPEFLDLCAAAWPGFASAYDSQVIGLWRCNSDLHENAIAEPTAMTPSKGIRSLLVTRRPNLAMWERSKLPEGAAEAAVRETLSRRYDLCTWTVVYTTTLFTAVDGTDRARWT